MMLMGGERILIAGMRGVRLMGEHLALYSIERGMMAMQA